MAEALMEHRGETQVDRLLLGTARGAALALRGASEEQAAALSLRFGTAFARVRFIEPCRTEHPHSAFLRKPAANHGRPAVQTTLYAPGGRLAEERSPEGEVFESFIRKPADFETLRGHLRDVELHPARASEAPEGCTGVACLGLTPLREMETRWAGLEMMATALAEGHEAAASCMRKLERQLHRRAEEACRLGCRVAVLRDMAAVPLPETYMLHAGRHIEWLRHNGLAPFVEVAEPIEPLLAALAAARAGARMSLSNPALYDESFAPPEDLRFLFDADARQGLDGFAPEQMKELLGKCCGAVILLDCFEAGPEELAAAVQTLSEICTL